MKVCVAQTRPVTGDIIQNIENHKVFIDKASLHGADIIIFPELSLTGYEPELAKNLAVEAGDVLLDSFQKISDLKNNTIGVGLPTKNERGICISMIIFQPGQERKVYSKKYLHADEEPFFVPGENICSLEIKEAKVALAICYEISIEQHAVEAFKHKPEVYVASVVKSVNGIDKAIIQLSEIAKTNATPVLMSNCIGFSDGSECAGRTSIWDNQGILKEQLDVENEGILIYDTKIKETILNINYFNNEFNNQIIS